MNEIFTSGTRLLMSIVGRIIYPEFPLGIYFINFTWGYFSHYVNINYTLSYLKHEFWSSCEASVSSWSPSGEFWCIMGTVVSVKTGYCTVSGSSRLGSGRIGSSSCCWDSPWHWSALSWISSSSSSLTVSVSVFSIFQDTPPSLLFLSTSELYNTQLRGFI